MTRRGQVLCVWAASGAARSLGACASRSTPVSAEAASEFGFTEDARDPTVRDKEAGYLRWRERDEPAGTADPKSAERRTHGLGTP